MTGLTPCSINDAVAGHLMETGYKDAAEVFRDYRQRCAGELIHKLLSAGLTAETIREWYGFMMLNGWKERKQVIKNIHSVFLERVWEFVEKAAESDNSDILGAIYTHECRTAFVTLARREAYANEPEREAYDVEETIPRLWEALIIMEESDC